MPKQSATVGGLLRSESVPDAPGEAIEISESSQGFLHRTPLPGRAVRRDLAAVAVAAGLIVFFVWLAWPVAVVVAAIALPAVAVARPGWLLALALNGFFIYLAVLDLGGRAPHTSITATYYLLLCAALVLVVLRGRGTLIRRAYRFVRSERIWAAAATFLAAWVLVNGAIYRVGGAEAAKLLAILVLVTVPAALAVLAVDQPVLGEMFDGIVFLACLLALADVVGIAAGRPVSFERFSPISDFDPINASIVPALGAAVLLARSPRGRGVRMPAALCVVTLAAACVLPGSRGPILALATTVVIVVVFLAGRSRFVYGGLVAFGLFVGVLGAGAIGTGSYLKQGIVDVPKIVHSGPAQSSPSGHGSSSGTPKSHSQPQLISTFSIREGWIEDALRGVPDAPIFGHGLVSLPDTTPEAAQMGVTGERRYPHNDLVEAVYSFGVVGLIPFLLLVGLPIVFAIALRIRQGVAPVALPLVLLCFAFLESNFSGEIAADSALWAFCALVVVCRVDARSAA